jgi:hypothetical protein
MLSAETITGISENDLSKLTEAEAGAILSVNGGNSRKAFITRYAPQTLTRSSGTSSSTRQGGMGPDTAEEVTYDNDGIPTQPFKLDCSLGDQGNPGDNHDTGKR